jgi:hypothetical protein
VTQTFAEKVRAVVEKTPKGKILLLGSVVGIAAIICWFLYFYFLFMAPPWFDELHVRVEKKWLEYTTDGLDGMRAQEIRTQFPQVLTQAVQEKSIEQCMQLPENSQVYDRDSNGNIFFDRKSTGAVRRPSRQGWYPRTECQRGYIEKTLDWKLCSIFDRKATWMNPNTCTIQAARSMRKQGLEPEAKEVCATISDSYKRDLCLDTSIK